MHRLTHVAVAALLVAGQSACSGADRPTAPRSAVASRASGGSGARATDHKVSMMDACDPTTFDAALHDPNACLRNGGMKFSEFIAQLQKHHEVGAWHFAPPMLNVEEGATLTAINRGGETHTFTEVEHFGGGIVPVLNQLSGNTTPASECLALEPDDFVPPGGTYTVTEEEAGVEHYQCCIHPWMRTTVRVRGS